MNRHIYKDFRLQVLTYITKYKKTNNKTKKHQKEESKSKKYCIAKLHKISEKNPENYARTYMNKKILSVFQKKTLNYIMGETLMAK